MKYLFVCYKRCQTCRKAKQWLEDNGVEYEWRDIDIQNPTEGELRRWAQAGSLQVKKMFNTSGQIYRSLGLSRKIKEMSNDEMFALLATDGMLVKRPLLIGGGKVLVGFKAGEWEKELL